MPPSVRSPLQLQLNIGDQIYVSLRDKPKPRKLQLPTALTAARPAEPAVSVAPPTAEVPTESSAAAPAPKAPSAPPPPLPKKH